MKNKVFKRMAAGAAALALVFGGTGAPAANFAPLDFDISAAASAPNKPTYNSGDFNYALLDDGTAEITEYIGSESTVSIPDTVGDDIKVTQIGSNAFYQTSITGVIIPDSVVRIGGYAFYRCMELSDVKISSEVRYINKGAFSMCKSLKSVTLPEKLESIGDTAFYGCKGLTEITIPAKVSSFELNAFKGCTNLKNVNVDSDNDRFSSIDGVMYNKEKTALIYCPKGRESIELPESVTEIGENALSECARLKEVTIPDGVTVIGRYAFSGCSGLKEITIPGNVTRINDGAFNGCGLTEITVPETVAYLGGYTFGNCKSLRSVTINCGISDIKSNTFENCDSLENVVLPESVETIRYAAFSGCGKLKSITLPSSLKTIDWRTFVDCVSLEKVVIPEGVGRVGTDAFYGCTNLKTVTLPESLKDIAGYAFGYYYSNAEGHATKVKDFTIICTKGSAAEQYAKDNGFRYAYSGSQLNPAFSCSVSKTAAELRWEPVPNAEKYGVARLIDGKWQLIAQGNKTSYVIRDLKPGRYYDVAVVAKFNGKWNMDFSAAETVRTESIYPVVSYQVKDHRFRLKWTAVPDAEKYCIADNKYNEKTGQNEWFIKAQVGGNVTTYTSPKVEGSYHIAVCAKVDGKWDITDILEREIEIFVP